MASRTLQVMFQMFNCAPKRCLTAANASHLGGVVRREGRVLPHVQPLGGERNEKEVSLQKNCGPGGR